MNFQLTEAVPSAIGKTKGNKTPTHQPTTQECASRKHENRRQSQHPAKSPTSFVAQLMLTTAISGRHKGDIGGRYVEGAESNIRHA